MDLQERARLKMENAQLVQALFEMEKELNAAKQATHDLAEWTLNERTHLVTETIHKPDNHVKSLQAPSQDVENDHAYNATNEPMSTENPVIISNTGAQGGSFPNEAVDVLAEPSQRSETAGLQLRNENNVQASINGEYQDIHSGDPFHTSFPRYLDGAPSGPSGRNTCSLCEASFTDTEVPQWSFSMDHLPRCRVWQTEWKLKSYIITRGTRIDIKNPPHWKGSYTTQPKHTPGWMTMAQKKLEEKLNERNEKMKREFFVEGVEERNFLDGEQWVQKADWMVKETNKGKKEYGPLESHDAAIKTDEPQVLEDSEVLGCGETGCSPPNAEVSGSITNQVDALIAEERRKAARRWGAG